MQHSRDRSTTTYCNKCNTARTGQLQHTVTSATQPGPVNYNILLQVQHSWHRSITTYCNKCNTADTGQLQHNVTCMCNTTGTVYEKTNEWRKTMSKPHIRFLCRCMVNHNDSTEGGRQQTVWFGEFPNLFWRPSAKPLQPLLHRKRQWVCTAKLIESVRPSRCIHSANATCKH